MRLPVPGQRGSIYFAYIRKNASTSLTRYLVDQTDIATLYPDNSQDYRFRQIAQSHGSIDQGEMRRQDKAAAILRDPMRRFYSTFCNKVVAQAGAGDFWNTVDMRVGEGARSLSVEDFVLRYFAPSATGRVDVHLIPQTYHMWTRPYDFLIRLDDLYSWARAALGPDIAERFFLVRLNAPEGAGPDPDPQQTIEELQMRFQSGRGVPSYEWISERVADHIRKIYAEDIAAWQTSRFWSSA